ncbi:MAG: hypothetical protein KDB14_34450 [Planctomycetales bacterium]|nr:hypothetical protein [Planctomycetales bacterium]
MSLFLLVAYVLSISLPVGLPPGEFDRQLDRLVPEDTIAYWSSAGIATPEGLEHLSTPTERFLAEPEIRAAMEELREQASRFAPQRANQQRAQVLQLGARLALLLAEQPAVAYLHQLNEDSLRGGIAVRLRQDGEQKRELAKFLESFGEPARKVLNHPVYALDHPDAPGRFEVAIVEDLLVLGVGGAEIETMLMRRRGEAPAWIGPLRDRFNIERPATLARVDVERLRIRLEELVRNGLPVDPIQMFGLREMKQFVAVTGLDRPQAVASNSGKANPEVTGGFVRLAALDLNREPQSLLSLLHGQPLTAEELSSVPANAQVALAARLDVRQALEVFAANLGDARAQADDGLERIEQSIGIKVREQLLGSLGDVWTLHTSVDTGGLIAGWVATVPVKDRSKVQLALALDRVRQVAERQRIGGRPLKIDWVKHRDVDIYSVPTYNWPPAVSYAVTEDRLVISFLPQAIKAFLDAGSNPSPRLPANARVNEQWQRGGAPTVLVKLDTRRIAEEARPWMLLAFYTLRRHWSRQDHDFDLSRLPGVAAFTRHADDAVLTLRHDDRGFVFEQRQALPGPSLPILLLLMMSM